MSDDQDKPAADPYANENPYARYQRINGGHVTPAQPKPPEFNSGWKISLTRTAFTSRAAGLWHP